tara:strand:- start:68705 stop:68875 length:171 start_codon:yes stop_codon:yes gene_type:complete
MIERKWVSYKEPDSLPLLPGEISIVDPNTFKIERVPRASLEPIYRDGGKIVAYRKK